MGTGEKKMKICVFGLWHLGSVTSASLAKLGHEVIGLDFNPELIKDLLDARAPISEPGLNELIHDCFRKKTLNFTTDPSFALEDAEVLWVTFDTPVDEQDNADVHSIEKKFDVVSSFIHGGTKIILSSQVPVGFTQYLQDRFCEKFPGKKNYFAYSPENLRLGKSIKIFLEPDRIIIGVHSGQKDIFSPLFSSISDRLEWMSIESAEMTKHAINAFLATSVCYANEVATLCEYVGANAKEVERGLKTEERIGPNAYLSPGNAISGGTLARDIRFLQKLGKINHLPVHLINSVLVSNDFHKTWIQRKCFETMGDLQGKAISVWGLTYKPGTNTLRRSLSIELCQWLKEQGAEVTAFDPVIAKVTPESLNFFSLSDSIKNSIEGADCIILSTEWPDFQKIDKDTITNMKGKIIIDPNGFIENILENAQNIRYFAVGRRYQ
jgi:UDPglucose 6-dehydrogenase